MAPGGYAHATINRLCVTRLTCEPSILSWTVGLGALAVVGLERRPPSAHLVCLPSECWSSRTSFPKLTSLQGRRYTRWNDRYCRYLPRVLYLNTSIVGTGWYEDVYVLLRMLTIVSHRNSLASPILVPSRCHILISLIRSNTRQTYRGVDYENERRTETLSIILTQGPRAWRYWGSCTGQPVPE